MKLGRAGAFLLLLSVGARPLASQARLQAAHANAVSPTTKSINVSVLATIRLLEEHPGRATRAREGAIIGSLIGATLGGIAGYQICRHNSSFTNDPCITGAIGGGVLGGIIGTLVGYSVGSDTKRSPRS
jgi:hypothetical protein